MQRCRFALSNGAIFISYRRKDTAASARGIYERLAQRFGADRVFFDVSIPAGTDFVDAIRGAITSSGAVVVVIGPDWFAGRSDELARRTPEDYVVFEVGTALEHGRLVLPVLVEGATMPLPDDLPPPVRPLATLEALEIDHERWDYDMGRLCERLEQVLTPAGDGPEPGRRFWDRPKALIIGGALLAVLVAVAIGAVLLGDGGGSGDDGAGDGSTEARLGDRPLSLSMQGNDVRELQALLGRLGFNAGSTQGVFDAQTARGVAAFQLCWGDRLEPDGRAGEATIAALRTHRIAVGTNGNDDLEGTSRGDVIFGLNGNDRIDGLTGDDKICAGEGEDVVGGGPGSDRLYGGADDDRLLGEAGDDTLLGYKGADRVDGGAGIDACLVESGDAAAGCER